LSTTYANGDLFVEEIGGTVYNATTGQNLSGGPNLLGTPGTTMAFETFIEGSSAPEPGTLALFGGGLFGLHWMKRRRAVRLGLRPTTK
jgi:hypothetical protein